MSTFFKDFILGGVSGCVAKTATAPIERVKLLLQTQDKNAVDKYDGALDCFTRVVKDQGAASLWRGNNANLIRYFPTQAVNFATKAKYNEMFVKCTKDENFGKFFLGTLAAGGAAGATSMSLVYPLDFARTSLAADKGVGKDKKYKSMSDCIQQTYRADGVVGLYKGFGMSLAGIIVYRAAYFGLYDVGKAMMFIPNEKPHPAKSFALAFTTDTFASCVSYPFDTIRQNQILANRALTEGKKDTEKRNAIETCRAIVQTEGVQGLYKGCLSNIARGLGGALVLVFYDQVKASQGAVKKTA